MNQTNKTNIFFDTEFTGLHKNTTLISIGLISDCGTTFYAELTDFDEKQLDGWLLTNVISNLLFDDLNAYKITSNEETNKFSVEMKCDSKKLKHELGIWLAQFGEVQMVSDCLAYDWVLFNDIFGTAFDIPKNIYYIPIDICTMLYVKGWDPDVSRETFIQPTVVMGAKHNALYDAKVIKAVYNTLIPTIIQ